MDKIDSEKIIEHLKSKWKGRSCPMCNKGPWNVQDSAYELRRFHGGSMLLGGPIIPVIPISCNNCGNTLLINAIMAGLVDREEEGKK